jgi:hypothetical protein
LAFCKGVPKKSENPRFAREISTIARRTKTNIAPVPGERPRTLRPFRNMGRPTPSLLVPKLLPGNARPPFSPQKVLRRCYEPREPFGLSFFSNQDCSSRWRLVGVGLGLRSWRCG